MYAAGKRSKSQDYCRKARRTSWLSCFSLNGFVVREQRPHSRVLFHREYKEALAPWESTVLAKPVRKVKEKVSLKERNLGWKGSCIEPQLVSTSTEIMNARTIRRCTPTFDIETVIEACGTPGNPNQKQVVTKPRQRLPTAS